MTRLIFFSLLFGGVFFCRFTDTPVFAQFGQIPKEQKFGDVIIRCTHEIATKAKKHQFAMFVNRLYKITLTANDSTASPVLRIFDDLGNEVTQRSSRGSAVIEFNPRRSAKHIITVNALTARKLGGYSLKIERATGFSQKEFTGRLTAQDPFDKIRKTCRHKVHLVRMRAGQSYVINMTGNFDTYLRVENSAGKNLAQDDDGGAGLNSRMTFRPPQTGVYRIIATTFSSRHLGNYKITLQRVGAGK